MNQRTHWRTQRSRGWGVRLTARVAVLLGIAVAFGIPAMAQQSGPSGGAVSLGTITLSAETRPDGQELAPGTYELRLTTREAAAIPAGPPSDVNRWVEFLQSGEVRGQEIATVITGSEISSVAKTSPPPVGAARVDALRDSEYVRIWANHEGTHYLIHLMTRG